MCGGGGNGLRHAMRNAWNLIASAGGGMAVFEEDIAYAAGGQRVSGSEFIAQGVEDLAAAGREDEAVTAPVTGVRHGLADSGRGAGNPDRTTLGAHASMLAYLALASMNSRRGGTSSPMSMEKMLSLSAAFSMVTWRSVRFSGFMVVSQSCSAFISPRPL